MRGVAAIFEGTLTEVSAEALAITLADGSNFTLAPAQIEQSQVWTPRTNIRRGAILGGAVGLVVGVGLVVTSDGPQAGPASGNATFGERFQTWKLIVPAVTGAAVGAVLGRFIRTSRWVPGFMPGAGPGGVALGWMAPVR